MVLLNYLLYLSFYKRLGMCTCALIRVSNDSNGRKKII